MKTPEVFTWELGRHQWGHHDTVGPLGGVKQMSVGVMVFLQFLLTKGSSHSYRVSQEPCLMVIDAIPVSCGSKRQINILSSMFDIQEEIKQRLKLLK